LLEINNSILFYNNELDNIYNNEIYNIYKDTIPYILMEFNVENIKKTLHLKYLNNLKINSNKLSIDTKKLNKQIIDLHNILNNETKLSITTNDINSETDILSENTDYLFLKPWNKLNQIHKVIKIKEYLNNLECQPKEKDNLKEQLIDFVKTKKKVKFTYDESKGKIISISALSFANGKYFIEEK